MRHLPGEGATGDAAPARQQPPIPSRPKVSLRASSAFGAQGNANSALPALSPGPPESLPPGRRQGAAGWEVRVPPLAPGFRRAESRDPPIGAAAAETAGGIVVSSSAAMPLTIILPNVIAVACTAGLIWLVVRAFRRR